MHVHNTHTYILIHTYTYTLIHTYTQYTHTAGEILLRIGNCLFSAPISHWCEYWGDLPNVASPSLAFVGFNCQRNRSFIHVLNLLFIAIRSNVLTHTYTHTHIHTIHTYAHTHTHLHTYTHIYIHMRPYIHTTHTYTQHAHTHTTKGLQCV